MSAFELAWRTARRHRAQTLLAVAGVAVIGALLFDMLLLSRGLLVSFADMLSSNGYDVRVVGAAGFGSRMPIANSDDLMARILPLPTVARVASIRLEQVSLRHGDKAAGGVTLIGSTEMGAGLWTVLRGVNPGTPTVEHETCPLVISDSFASAHGLEPGSSVTVSARPSGVRSALPPVACRVVAVAQFTMPGGGGDDAVATTVAAFNTVAAGSRATDADFILITSREGTPPGATAKAVQALATEARVYSNEDVVAQFNQNGFAYFRQISVVLSSVTTAFACLLVATLLTVSINQRLGEIAALRALGIGRQRIASMLLWESTLLVGAGGVLAVPLGELLAIGLDRILKQMPGLPDRLHFFVFEPRALVIHVAVLAVTALVAAAYPIWLTARLPIASTLRREVLG